MLSHHMHVHPRNDSWAELVLANIYYFIDVSLKKGVRGVMFLTNWKFKSHVGVSIGNFVYFNSF
jgi:hypothetical protein